MLLIHFMALSAFYNPPSHPHLTPPLHSPKAENQSFCNVFGVKKEISDMKWAERG